jgi:hypothetical protein
VQPLIRNDISFQNDGHIGKIAVPIMIMHAKDDYVIPSLLGRRVINEPFEYPTHTHTLMSIFINRLDFLTAFRNWQTKTYC